MFTLLRSYRFLLRSTSFYSVHPLFQGRSKNVAERERAIKHKIQTCAYEKKNSHPKHLLCGIKKNHLDYPVCSIQTKFKKMGEKKINFMLGIIAYLDL